MNYHVTLARNNVYGELGGSRFLCSLDDFNKLCAAVIVKKKELALQVFEHCSYHQGSDLAQINQPFFKFILVREYFNKTGFWGLLSTWRPLFTFL